MGSIPTRKEFFGQRPLVPLLLLVPPFFLIILFLFTTLLNGITYWHLLALAMNGLYMTSQSRGSFLKREQLVCLLMIKFQAQKCYFRQTYLLG
jgi:hypothetical protein